MLVTKVKLSAGQRTALSAAKFVVSLASGKLATVDTLYAAAGVIVRYLCVIGQTDAVSVLRSAGCFDNDQPYNGQRRRISGARSHTAKDQLEALATTTVAFAPAIVGDDDAAD